MTKKKPGAIQVFRRLFPHLSYFTIIQEVRKQVRGCQSCLEIGCGTGSPARDAAFERYVGVDGYAPVVEQAKRDDPDNEYLLGRAEEIATMFAPREFDCVLALDLIEHLTKEDGLKLIKDMESLAKKRIVLFTPNGFLSQQSHDGDLQEHLSGWDADEMRALGFKVIGMLGPKRLRGAYHLPKIRPSVVGGSVSQLGQVVTRYMPRAATAILCVKETS